MADFVQVESWIRDDGVVYKHTEKEDFGRVALEMLYDLVGWAIHVVRWKHPL